MKTVVGLVSGHREAEILMQELTARGFKQEDIEIIPLQAVGDQVISQKCAWSVEEFFGADEAPQVRGYYAAVDRPMGMVVSVFVEDEEVDRAATAMVPYGGVRIYNHSTEKPIVEELPLQERDGPFESSGIH
ncbi:MAG: hypothetical protein C4576_15095 [Desulfobacteraceae bacterium]|nr:MAG: hypothetical protein C4576_15095 [Desulfobacteraceae bacterium]